MASQWFSVKTFYRSYADGRPVKPDRFCDPDATLVEERTLLIKAKNKGEAIKKAEKDAYEYAKKVDYTNPYEQKVRMEYLGIYDIFDVGPSLSDKKEIFVINRVMSKKISKHKIAHVYINKAERSQEQTKRKKFLNKEYYGF